MCSTTPFFLEPYHETVVLIHKEASPGSPGGRSQNIVTGACISRKNQGADLPYFLEGGSTVQWVQSLQSSRQGCYSRNPNGMLSVCSLLPKSRWKIFIFAVLRMLASGQMKQCQVQRDFALRAKVAGRSLLTAHVLDCLGEPRAEGWSSLFTVGGGLPFFPLKQKSGKNLSKVKVASAPFIQGWGGMQNLNSRCEHFTLSPVPVPPVTLSISVLVACP